MHWGIEALWVMMGVLLSRHPSVEAVAVVVLLAVSRLSKDAIFKDAWTARFATVLASRSQEMASWILHTSASASLLQAPL